MVSNGEEEGRRNDWGERVGSGGGREGEEWMETVERETGDKPEAEWKPPKTKDGTASGCLCLPAFARWCVVDWRRDET